MIDKKPEVLAPAGDRERLEAALRFGADAVYLGGKLFNMRAGTRSFTQEELAEAVKLTHQMGRRLYLTCNTLLNNEEADLLPRYLAEVHEMGVDAAIVSDIGVLMAAHRAVPELELHISTQAGVTNWLTAAELHRLGAKRVVLARELPLTEIEELCRRIPRELEVEVFVHGAMCMSVSGRCLLSQYLTGRDANRGACTQPCRWKYALMEEKRPGQYYPVEEDGHYSYILNAKDLCLIEYLDKLAKAGVHSFKIEGRAKSAYYTAVTAGAYRAATDLMWRDPEHYRCPDWLREEVGRLKAEARFTCRTSGKATLAADIRIMLDIYRESWAKNWGFSPLSDGEAEHHVKELKSVLDPEFFVLFFHNNEPAAGMVALPDMNPLLKRLNGKLGLTQAEAVMDLISADGRQGAALANASLNGALAKKIGAEKDALTALQAHLTAWVDFPEEDVPALEDAQLVSTLTAVKGELDTLIRNYDAGAVLREGVDCAIVGRPNAGKSTLLNRLTDAGVLAEDKLFATLDTTARGLQLPDGRTVLLVDTVGLIRRLPHHLVQAFHATLEEAATADLVLNLCDASSPDAAEHLAITGTLLSDLGRGELPVLQVFNKCDRLTAENADIALPPRTADGGERLYISAKTGEGIDKLLAAIAAALPRDREKVTVLLPFSAGALAETCRREGAVESEEYVPEGLRMTVTVDKRLLHQLKAAGATFFEE